MNTYYLVLGQCDAYITSEWFKNKEYALKRAEEVRGKELLVEEIQAVDLQAYFSDSEYISEELYDKMEAHENYKGEPEGYMVGINDDCTGYSVGDRNYKEVFNGSLEELIEFLKELY